jgi:hypothetical protein
VGSFEVFDPDGFDVKIKFPFEEESAIDISFVDSEASRMLDELKRQFANTEYSDREVETLKVVVDDEDVVRLGKTMRAKFEIECAYGDALQVFKMLVALDRLFGVKDPQCLPKKSS